MREIREKKQESASKAQVGARDKEGCSEKVPLSEDRKGGHNPPGYLKKAHSVLRESTCKGPKAGGQRDLEVLEEPPSSQGRRRPA